MRSKVSAFSKNPGRELPQIARWWPPRHRSTSLAPGGGVISTIYVIDGTKLISVTARTEKEQDKTAFLGSFKLLQ
jgi:hypothetical protein